MKKRLLLIIVLFLSYLRTVDANQPDEGIKYLSPVPGSNYNSTETNIIIKFDGAIFPESTGSGLIIVKGSKSGKHEGITKLINNNKTLLFYPSEAFETNENVEVKIMNIRQKNSLDKIINLKYSFRTSKIKVNQKESITQEVLKNQLQSFRLSQKSQLFTLGAKNNLVKDISLPSDFPEMRFEENNPSPGVISFAPFSFVNGVFLPNYMIMIDNYGQPIFYRKTSNAVLDFKMQKNGLLSYFDMGVGKYFLMDNHLNIIDSLYMKNGYPTDLHEFVITNDNHYWMMSYDIQKMGMDTVYSGGNPNASVVGLIIQEQDENRDVVFQWRSWDHFKITDATYDIDLTGEYIDYSHGNAIEIDTDGNILISSRHMDEITKINRETGEIIWRWGGKYCKNNQFTFVNDSIGFSHQHYIRRLKNGNLMVFDNGNLHSPPFSRAAEYYLNEDIKIASLVWEFRNNPQTYSIAMGSAERLENGNTFIGWGLNADPPSISEVKMDGMVTITVTLPDTLVNYRAFKFPWKTGILTADADSIDFGSVRPGNTKESTINLSNNGTVPIEINQIFLNSPVFSMNQELPIEIMPSQIKSISVLFKPGQEGRYSSRLYLRWKETTQMIAQTVNLTGTADTTTTSIENSSRIGYSLSQNYPNPFNPVTIISYSIPEETFVKLRIYNALGREIVTLRNELQKAGHYTAEFNAEKLPSGIYYYTLETNRFTNTKKMLILK